MSLLWQNGHSEIASRIKQLALPIAAPIGIPFNMRAVAALVYFLGLASPMSTEMGIAQSRQATVNVQLQEGIEKEEVEGDLVAAIEIYQKITADKGVPREVRAKALLRLAGCDERLGKQAKQVYEQIVREYGDQPVASQARSRLAVLARKEHPAPPLMMSERKIEWSKLGSLGHTDTDGERAVYWNENNLYFGDIAGHNRRLILNAKQFDWVPSRDFALVALDLLATPERRHILALIKTDGTGYRELVRDDEHDSTFGENVSFAMSWSWDDRFLALADFSLRTKIAGQLWVVSTTNGQRRILADIPGERVRKSNFSPDGKYLAFVTYPRDMVSHSTSRIYVVPVAGGEPRLVYESMPWAVGSSFLSFLDWTGDGRFLAIKDVRNGRSALYLLPIRDGAPSGELRFVRFGEFEEGMTTQSGALVFMDIAALPATTPIYLSTVEQNGKLHDWRDLKLNGGGKVSPSFSPDGRSIAYTARDVDATRSNLMIYDLLTGRERMIYRSEYESLNCKYSSLHPKVFCIVEKERGISNLISVETESGAVEQIATFPGSRFLMLPIVDDQIFYFTLAAWTLDPFAPPIVRWDRTTQEEKTVVPASNDRTFVRPSLDGRLMIRQTGGIVFVRPIDGGDWQPVTSKARANLVPATSADGKWVLYVGEDAVGKSALFGVPVSGGTPETLAEFTDAFVPSVLTFSHDNKQVLAEINTHPLAEIWVLENYVPARK
jgi:Tol biopolymer transport system component